MAAQRKKPSKSGPSAKKKSSPAAGKRGQSEGVAVSMTAAAKELGVTRTAIKQAIDEGRLSKSVTKIERGKQPVYRIDLDLARAEWRANTAPPNGKARHAIDPEDLDAGPPGGAPAEDGIPNFANARARKEHAMAEKAELDVLERRELLVNRPIAKRVILTIGRDLIAAIESFSARNSAALYACKNKKAHEIKLENEMAKLAASLADTVDAYLAEMRERERIA